MLASCPLQQDVEVKVAALLHPTRQPNGRPEFKSCHWIHLQPFLRCQNWAFFKESCRHFQRLRGYQNQVFVTGSRTISIRERNVSILSQTMTLS